MDFYNSKLAKIIGWFKSRQDYAITIGQTSYYSVPRYMVSPGWKRHEDYHKAQWKRDGFMTFAVCYLWYSLRYGYKNNPYEIEARFKSGFPEEVK